MWHSLVAMGPPQHLLAKKAVSAGLNVYMFVC